MGYSFDLKDLNGRWGSVLTEFTGKQYFDHKHHPCLLCGGKDRFRFTEKGVCICNQCSSEGLSPFDLLKQYLNVDSPELIKRLKDRYGSQLPTKTTVIDNNNPEYVIPVKNKLHITNNMYISAFTKRSSKPITNMYETVWEWISPDGTHIGYLAKQIKDGKKRVLQILDTEKGLYQGTYGKDRPLFGGEYFNQSQEKHVFEGEKTTTFAGNNFGVAALTWVGGANVPHLTDFSALHGHTVYLHPDNDRVGIEAMEKVAKEIADYCTVYIVYPPEDKPEGWDVADINDCFFSFTEYYKDRAKAFKKKEVVVAQPEMILTEKDEMLREIKPLGYDQGKIYVMPRQDLQIRCLAMTDLGESTLVTLAPTPFWYKHFCSEEETKPNWKRARDWLLLACRREGVYDEENIRGRGVWIDNGKVVAHLGGSLIVDGVPTQIIDHKSEFVYYKKKQLFKWNNEVLSNDERKFILRCCKAIHWVDYHETPEGMKPLAPAFLAGYLVSGMVCGSLEWLTHIWITGPAGAGKSTVLKELVHRLFSKWSIYAEGASSEAGIRQKIGTDAIPLIYDEPEQDSQKAADRVECIIEFLRSASTKSESRIFKGTAGGEANEFAVTVQGLLGSINFGIKKKADHDRFVILEMAGQKVPGFNWEEERKIISQITEEMGAKLFQLAVLKAKQIKRNIQLCSKILATEKFHSHRYGDKYGNLIGAYHILVNPDGLKDEEEARQMLNEFYWGNTREETNEDENEETSLLEIIKQSIVSVKPESGGAKDYTIGELIVKVASNKTSWDMFDTFQIKKDDVILTLAQYGLFYIRGRVRVANSNVNMKKLLRNYPKYAYNWNNILKRLDGAEKLKNAQYMGILGNTHRCIEIPIKHFYNEELQGEDI